MSRTLPFDAEDADLDADDLDAKYNQDGTGQHPYFTHAKWAAAVQAGQTYRGYWQWISAELAAYAYWSPELNTATTYFRVDAIEMFMVRTVYFARAHDRRHAEHLCRQGHIAYHTSETLEGNEQWVDTKSVEPIALADVPPSALDHPKEIVS
jgi:hypothetical protein